MKLLIICAVLSVCVTASLSSPVQIQVRDEIDTSASAESKEIKISENDSSSSEEEQPKVKDSLSDSSEEQLENIEIVKDAANENTSVEEQELADDFIIKRDKRAVISVPHTSNQLSVNAKSSIKTGKYLRLRLNDDRNKRSADTSEENSSEEKAKDKSQAQGVVIAKKPETAPAETLQLASNPNAGPAETLATLLDIRRKRNSPSTDSSEESSSEEEKPEATKKSETAEAAKPDAAAAESSPKTDALRRRRSQEYFSEEDQSQQAQDENEVFLLSKEKQADVEESNVDFDSYEHTVLSDKTFGNPKSSLESKNSEEDYAQGCGGNRDDNSNENSNEKNELLSDNLYTL